MSYLDLRSMEADDRRSQPMNIVASIATIHG
jgi:hypothetical protein